MHNIPQELRDVLTERVPLSTLTLVNQQESRIDGTVKALFHTADGRPVEAVLMRFSMVDGRSASPRSQGARSPAPSARRAR